MAEQTFKSPGYFEREIDLSQRKPVKSNVIPGGIIGIAASGPAFVPVTVSSITDFKENFGSIKPEFYGAIAADEFLKNTPNLTYIRVLGAGVIETSAQLTNLKKFGVSPSAGFQLSGSASEDFENKTGEQRHVGCIQFIAGVHTRQTNEQYGATYFSKNQSFSTAEVNLIRGAVLMASGARLEILDYNSSYPAGGATSDDQAKIQDYDSTSKQGTFKLVISSSVGATFGNDEEKVGIKIYTASLDPDSEYYFGKVLNTSEDQFHTKQHLLYADFIVEKDLAKNKYDASNSTVGILSGSGNTSSDGDSSKHFREVFGSFNSRYKSARTTEFISQPFGNQEYDLFHFETIADGESANKLYSISISNLKKSLTAENQYGSFTVELRSYNNNDLGLNIIEQYSNCTLNPDDASFVGKLIGDSKLKYNFDTLIEKERGLITEGTYPNKSKYVRIVLNDAVVNKLIPKESLPFGFRGLPVLKTTDTLTDTSTPITGLGSTGIRLGSIGAVAAMNYSVIPPLPFTYKLTKGSINSSPSFPGDPSQDELTDARLYWGIQPGRLSQNTSVNANGGLGNPELFPNVRINSLQSSIDAYSKFLGIAGLDAVVTGSGADEFHNHKFTLSRVALNNQSDVSNSIDTAITTELTASVSNHIKEAAYIRNATIDQPNYTINDGTLGKRITFATLAAGKPANFNKFSDYLKFTNIFYGGFDGLNILDKDSRLMNDKASSLDAGGKAAGGTISYQNLTSVSSPGTGLNNNIVASYIQAAKIITLEGATNINILAIPGIREKLITNKVSDLVKDNSKIIYLMDIPSFDSSNNRLYTDSSNRPSVEKTIDKFEARGIDNNYVATYFPDVNIVSDQFSKRAEVPASVSAMQALSYNDKVSYPWFAPAGFARGVLDNVANTTVRLTSADRDALYEARINPIANFAIGKIVIFGQKTLQANKSALDRVNVRRMVLKVKRIVSSIGKDFLFEQNTPKTRGKFVARVAPQLGLIQSQQGIDKFKVIMDESNNTTLDEEQNRLNGSIVIVPTRAIEYIAIDFIITNSGVSF